MKRLRQGSETQLRMLPKAEMPPAPLEKELVDAIRITAYRLGLITWSGRIHLRGHTPPYLPILGPGTPDVLGVLRDGRLWGLEAKRDGSSRERESQTRWAREHPQVATRTVRSVAEAVEFWEEIR